MANRNNLFTALLLVCIVAAAGTAAGQLEIPFRQVNKLIILDARINGKPALLVMDCGATVTIVNARLLEISDWDLHAAKFTTEGPGLSGEAVWADAVITLGATQGSRRRVVGMNLDGFAGSLGRHIDGLLGQDFLSEFDHVVIDFKRKKLLLYR